MFSVNAPGFFVFMAVLLLIWYRLPASKRWYAMLGAGIVFYLSLDIPGFFVLLASALVVWFCASRAGPKAPGNSRLWLDVYKRQGLAFGNVPNAARTLEGPPLHSGL